MINLFQPALGDEEVAAIREVFRSNWIGKGKVTGEFESRFAEYVGVDRRHIRSLSCCTEGLFGAMELLGIGPDDEVVLPTISFVGAGNAVAARGARPVFCDVDYRSLNASADTISRKITARTRAVMIIHYGGVPCDMDAIIELTREHNLPLIEDNACSVASRYKGKPCGTLGDIGVWSFDSMKILVTGDGGMVYCKNPGMAQRMEELTYLGLITASGFGSKIDSKWWEFEISCFGRRAIINDITAAIGLEQLKKLPGFIRRRQQIHEFYDERLGGLSWLSVPPPSQPDVESSYYFYWIQVHEELRDRLAVSLRQNGVYSTFRYYPLHFVKAYGVTDNLPGAERAARSTLCIPIHQSLTDGEVEKIVSCISAFAK